MATLLAITYPFLTIIKIGCMINDKEHWTEIGGSDSIDDCNIMCSTDLEYWNWFVFQNGTCFCLDKITTGFWHEEDCKHKVENVDKVTVHKLWTLSCPSLELSTKALILTKYNPKLLIGSSATLECMLGHELADGTTSLEINCMTNGQWSVAEIPTCDPVTCKTNPEAIPGSNGIIKHHIKMLEDSFVANSSFSLFCPTEKYFYEDEHERIDSLTVNCMPNRYLSFTYF